MSKFTAKQKEIVARKLGYEGPMQGFDEFLQSSPALQMKYGMISDKYMAKGGVVRKYETGGDVSTNFDTNIAAEYIKYREGFPDAQGAMQTFSADTIRRMIEEKYGPQSHQQLAQYEVAYNEKYVNDKKQALQKILPSDWTTYTPQQKINFFNEKNISPEWLKTVGVSDAEISWMRQQENGYKVPSAPAPSPAPVNWDSAAPAPTPAPAPAPAPTPAPAPASAAITTRPDTGSQVPQVRTDTTTTGAKQFKLNIDPKTATPQQKAAEYNRLRSEGFTDAEIRSGADAATGGKQSDADWSSLQKLASTTGTTYPAKPSTTTYGPTGVPIAGSTQQVQAQQTSTEGLTVDATKPDYQLGEAPLADLKKTATAEQATVGGSRFTGPKVSSEDILSMAVGKTPKDMQYDLNNDGKITSADAALYSKQQAQPSGTIATGQTYEASTTLPTVQEQLNKLTAETGTVSEEAKAKAETGTLSEGAIAKAVAPVKAAEVTPVEPLVKTPEMLAKAATVADVGGAPTAKAEQSTYQSQIEAKTRDVTAGELIDVEKQNLKMETVQAVAATMDKLNSDAVALAAQGNLFAGQAEAQQGRVQAEMTVRNQLEKYMADFNDGTPAWAAGAMRNANAIMAARGLGGSSMAGAAIVQAAMEAATPLAAADAQTFTQMELTNLNNRQQVALANAANAQQMELANLNARQQAALQNSANAFALQSQNLSNVQATVLANAQFRAAAAEKNLDVRTQAALVNAARVAEVNNINLSNSQQAMLARSAENLQVDLANLSTRQQTAIANAQIEASLKGQELSNKQQTAIVNASRIAEIAQVNFTAKQQNAIANAQFIQQINLQDMSNQQAVVLANAAATATMDMANLNARQQAAVQNAQAFLAMDMANLDNTQKTALFKAQQLAQIALSDAAAENAAKQFNAANKQQADQFAASLATQVSQFNAAQKNAMEQFNTGEANAMEKYNSQLKSQREQFNVQNRTVIDQANAQLLAQVSTANTAAVNAANFANAQAMNNMTMAQYNNEVQLYRDQVKMVYDSYERAEDRSASMATALLQADVQRENIDAQTSASYGKLIGSFLGTKAGEKVIDKVVDFVGDLFGG